MHCQLLLNLDATTSGRGGRKESGHNAVTRMLNVAPAQAKERITHDATVNLKYRHRSVITLVLRQAGRVDDVGKQHGARARIEFATSRRAHRTALIDF